MQNEEWKPVPGYEGYYEVSDRGRIRSVDREIEDVSGGTRHLDGREIALFDDGGVTRVSFSREGEKESFSLARIVLELHGPDRPFPTAVAKKIDDGGDCSIENVEWRRPVGRSKLTEDQVIAIYKTAHREDRPQSEIARQYDISRQTVSQIKTGRVWTHVTDDIFPPESQGGAQPNQHS